MPAVVSGVNAAPMPTPIRISGAPMPRRRPCRGDPAEPRHPGRGQEQAADEQRQVAEPRGDARHDAHEREQHERHRQEREARLQRDSPRTPCRYWVRKKNMENIPPTASMRAT